MKVHSIIKPFVLFFLLNGCYLQFTCAQDSFDRPRCNQGQQNKVENQGNNVILPKAADKDISSEAPIDPNEIIGLIGYDAVGSADTLRWVSATQTLTYTVYFENDPDLATAAASKVTINVPLHPKLNHATLGIGSFGFGNHIFSVEGSPSSYQTRIDLRDSLGIFVDVVAGLDIVHNEAFWIFQSIDPATGLPPTDIHRGFLPINDSLHSGEGFVSFTIKPKTDQCVTGDTVSATASIVFDVNEPIPTNTWVNTIDAFPPTSTLNMVPNGADQLVATFSGEDDEGGCGVKQYKLYYSVNNNAYQLYDVYPVGNTAEIPLESGSEYQFFVLAEDHVGNCEPMKNQSEYNIGTNYVTLAVNAFPQEAGTVTGGGGYAVNDTAVLTATALEGYHFVNWMVQGAPVSPQNPYSVVVTQNQTYTAYFERDAYTLQTVAAEGSVIRVSDINGNEIPSGSTIYHSDRLIVSTDTLSCYQMTGCLLNGNVYVPGDTLTINGDVQIVTQTISRHDYTEFTEEVCESYTWNGITYIQSSDYTQTFTSSSGCDSIVTLHLTVNHTTYGDTTAIACGSITWHGNTYTQSGNYTDSLTNVAGCDSVVTLHLTINQGDYAEVIVDTCGTEFFWEVSGQSYDHSDTYYFFSNDVNACQDTTVLVLSLHQAAVTELAAQICEGEIYSQNGFNVSEEGDYEQHLHTVFGCDSTVILHLAVNSETVTNIAASVCEGVDYMDNGFEIVAPAVGVHEFRDTIHRQGTCDSIVVLLLTVNQPATTDTTAIACDSFIWHGETYTESGDYPLTLSNAAGCDSVVTLHLTVNNSNNGDTAAVACDSFTWHGETYTESGDYPMTLSNAAGCDSVVTLHLTVNNSNTGDTTAVACDSFTWHGATYNESGDYQFTFSNAVNCDSVVTLHLTVNHTSTGDTAAIACDSFIWHGETYTESGDYPLTLSNAAGCDSVLTLHLTVNNSNTGDTTAVACGSFDWYEHVGMTTSGEYTHTFTNVGGCDSIVTLHLTIHYPVHTAVTETACSSFLWNGITYTQSGTYTFSHLDANGCTQVDTLHLTIYNPVHTAVSETACESFVWNGITYTQNGTYTHGHLDANGCTQVDTLHLIIHNPVHIAVTETACESFTWNGITYTQSGTYTFSHLDVNGCTQVDTLHLIIHNPVHTAVTETSCVSFLWNGTLYTQSGTYTFSHLDANGCTQVDTLHLTIYNPVHTAVSETACANFVWNGVSYTQSGAYTQGHLDANGCTQVDTLHLTINQPTTGDTTAVACDSFTWNGNTYTESGDYTSYLTNVAGCDSVVTLHLTINPSNAVDTTVFACESFTWNGTTYTESGDYTTDQTNAAGCDSVVTLHLTIADAPALQAISGETEICLNQFATYTYDISEPDYQYRWFKDNALWAENVPQVTLHEMGEGSVLLTMSVADEQNGCAADTSLLVQVVNRIAPDTTEIRRKGSTNILICQPVTSSYGEVHYRWGYTNRFTYNEATMPGDHNYCLYDFGIDTLSYFYWVETYLNNPIGEGCDNRSYYGHSVLTSTSDYDANTVEAYMSRDHIILYVSALSPENVSASLYDVNGKLLLTRGYGITDVVSDAIAVNIAPGVYFLSVSVGNEFYSFKLLKL